MFVFFSLSPTQGLELGKDAIACEIVKDENRSKVFDPPAVGVSGNFSVSRFAADSSCITPTGSLYVRTRYLVPTEGSFAVLFSPATNCAELSFVLVPYGPSKLSPLELVVLH